MDLVRMLEPFAMEPDRIDAIAQAVHGFPDRAIRLRKDRLEVPLPFGTEPIPWFDEGRWVCDAEVRPSTFLNHAVADYYIQDAGSMLALAVAGDVHNLKVCDLCAAPGGKASAFAERLGPGGLLIANEAIRSRLDLLELALARTGSVRYATCQRDPEELAICFPSYFDLILIDAPCSGQTLVGTGKRGDNAFSEAQIQHSVLRQRRILDEAAKMLRVGGLLVYSTCTFATEENEDQIRWLREQDHDCWDPVSIASLAPWKSPLEEGCYRLWPDRDRCAGSFAAGLRLKNELPRSSTRSNSDRTRMHRKSTAQRGVKRGAKRLDPGIEKELESLGRLESIAIEGCEDRWHAIAEELYPLAGTPILRFPILATEHGNRESSRVKGRVPIAPSHAMAMMRPEFFSPSQTTPLTDEKAYAFSKGEAITSQQNAQGWSVATWNGRALGWLKQIDTRCNNYLPKIARA